jgi:hypothetical protein
MDINPQDLVYNPAWFNQEQESPFNDFVNTMTQLQQQQEQNSNPELTGADNQQDMLDMFDEMKNTLAEMQSIKAQYTQQSSAAEDDDYSDIEDYRALFEDTDENTPVDWSARAEYKNSDAARKSYEFFLQKGLPAHQAAGIVGNLAIESGNFDPNVISGKRKGDGGKATGIAQWHPDRFGNVQRVASQAGHSPYTLEGQLEGVWWELNNTEKGAFNKLKYTTTAADAALSFDKNYERSAGLHTRQRQQKANNILKSFQ